MTKISPHAHACFLVSEKTLPFLDGSCAGKDCRLSNEQPSVERLQLIPRGLPHCQGCDIQFRKEQKCRNVTVSVARTSVITAKTGAAVLRVFI
jgi:hypothetical protein